MSNPNPVTIDLPEGEDAEPSAQFSPFKSTPMDRHGDTQKGRELAAREAESMFSRFVSILRNAYADTAGLRARRDRYAERVARLQERIDELDAQVAAIVDAERPRAGARLRQAVVWFVQYVRGARRKPPSSWDFGSGGIRLTKNRTRTEWVDDEDLLDALRSADIPFVALEACQRVKVVPDKTFIGKHLENREDGQYFVWTDPETGEVHETRVGVEEARPGNEVIIVPLRRTVEPPQPYKLEIIVNDVAEEVEAPWLALGEAESEDDGGDTDGDN